LDVGKQFLAGSLAKRCPQEGNPIVQVASLFNQLLQHFPRTEFAALVKKHAAERDAKGFTCWTQFVSMLFCQLGRADSLREICNGLGCCLGRLVHVGIARAPCRSTLSYANEHRPAALFEDLFFTALARFREQQGLGTRKHKFRFKNKLLSLDSTTISLCLTLFPWAKFRRAKGGVKAHVLLDHDDYLPAYVLLTEAKRNDVKLADSFRLNPGSIVAIDRGYIDYILNHVQAQLITWENAAPRSIVTITGASISIEPIGMAAFVCVVPSEANRFEIPTWVLLALPPSADMPDLPVSTGFLSVSFGTLQKLPTRAFLK